jgi:hypothetical protein
MPVVRRNEPWEVMFREEVSGLASGWTVREHRGKVKLVVRRPDQGMESITLPFPWAKASMGDAYTRLRNIYVHWSEGYGLRAAAELVTVRRRPPCWIGPRRRSGFRSRSATTATTSRRPPGCMPINLW